MNGSNPEKGQPSVRAAEDDSDWFGDVVETATTESLPDESEGEVPPSNSDGGADGSDSDDTDSGKPALDGNGVADAEVVDAEVVDAEVVDAEVVDAEVVDAEVVDAEVIEQNKAKGFVGSDEPQPSAHSAGDDASVSVEQLVADLERVAGERDKYLDASRRLQAEFENYKKVVVKREADARARANESLVSELLPVLDACDGAVNNGSDDVKPVRSALLEALTKQGLKRLEPADAPFDPAEHEAVMHDPAEDEKGPVVTEVMRAGYSLKGRVVRPAMVRVRG